jgi:cytochrome c2
MHSENFVFARQVATLALLFTAVTACAEELELKREPASRFDLAVVARPGGQSRPETRYLSWQQLRALPTEKLQIEGEFLRGKQEITVAYLDELWSRLPRDRTADTVLASCSDGYAAVFTRRFMEQFRPFIVLEINGQGPEKWPLEGMSANPGPYVISVSATVAPGVAQLLDAGHKQPWGVTSIELVNFSEAFRGIFSGPWAAATPPAAAGREIWINSCACCHQGPAQTFGGTKSDQPFEVLQAVAAWNPDFFKKYVRAPASLMPAAKMEAHPHYNDSQLDSLIAFLRAGRGTP